MGSNYQDIQYLSEGPRPGNPLKDKDRGHRGVTIIIPNLNGRRHLPRCLESLTLTTGIAYEIIVVDNGSSDDSVEWTRQNYPDVRVIALGENKGFSGALMTGVRQAGRPLICFLNNDTEVRPDCLANLARTLESDPEIGAVSATLLYMHNPEMINFGGGGMTKPGYGYQDRLGWPVLSLKDMPEIEDTLFPSGAAMLIDRDLLLDCGGLDEELFPIYHEDVDLGWRLWLLGYRVVISRKSVVLHHEGGQAGPRPGAERIALLGFRHSIRCTIKNYELKNMLNALGAMIISQVLAQYLALFSRLSTRRKRPARAAFMVLALVTRTYPMAARIWPALWWNLSRLSDTLRQRRSIQARRKRRDSELFCRGLIRPRPWFPFQGQEPESWEVPFEQLFLQSELYPGQDSAIGRLGGGWGPTCNYRGRQGRMLMYHARCRLRVNPATSGRLEIRVGLVDAANRGRIRVICNRNVSRWEKLARNNPITVRCEAVSDEKGELEVDIVADADDYSERFRSWWCGVYRIKFIPDNRISDIVWYMKDVNVSVIIPTYNRSSRLRDCLRALTRQKFLPREVIVINDGSTDGTAEFLAELVASGSWPFTLKTAGLSNAGPARARNLGLKMASGNLIAFLGDDMIPRSDWLLRHVQAHREKGFSCAVCGFTDWDRSRIQVSPLLEFVNRSGYQFGFGYMPSDKEVPLTCFYTSNLSIPSAYLANNRFDEGFKQAAFEDTELGFRLCVRGMRIIYKPRCVVLHHHPMTASDFCRRQEQVGELLVWMIRRRPEMKAHLPFPDINLVHQSRLKKEVLRVAYKLWNRLDRWNIKLPRSIYYLWLDSLFFTGIENARQRSSGRP